ncbi:MAG: Hsp70 family protein, partial [Deltaproteobacteria bacterium]|nr:Hsp70 family protein [Deltaproteobacteria bacterium]
ESTQRLLARVRRGAADPAKIGRLVTVVEDDLGMPLHRAVEGAKVRLSGQALARVTLPPVDLDLGISRDAFDSWIAEDLAAIDAVLDDVLARAGVTAEQVDRAFATGGSSLVPAVRAHLAARFGGDKLVGGEELTSVAWGLAARAHQLWS